MPQRRIIKRRLIVKGRPLVPGLAYGHVFYYRDILSRDTEVVDLSPEQLDDEWRRVQRAIRKLRGQLSHMRRNVAKEISSEHAAIFEVHRHVLKDKTLIAELEQELRERMVNAEPVVRDVFHRYERKLDASKNEKLRERGSDIADVGRRLLHILEGIDDNPLSHIPPDSIICARRMLPSDTVHLNARRTRAIVVKEGGPNSHSAILARAMDIPLVAATGLAQRNIPNGTPALLDGGTGRIIVNPRPEEKRKWRAAISRRRRRRKRVAQRVSRKPCRFGGEDVTIQASVTTYHDVLTAQRYGCHSIGLYRIEPFFMASRGLPSEDTLYQQLYESLQRGSVADATIRLLDVGGDKKLPYLPMEQPRHPLLGLRGVRLLIHYPNLLSSQLRVCLRLSAHFRIRILIPFVSLPHDVSIVKSYLQDAKQELKRRDVTFDESVQVGAMVEVPAAVLALREFCRHVDFVSIGTNDLIQYTMAADREDLSVAQYSEAGVSLIFPSLRRVLDIATSCGTGCVLCGELAAEQGRIKDLLQMGFRTFSILPNKIPLVKDAILSLGS